VATFTRVKSVSASSVLRTRVMVEYWYVDQPETDVGVV
jgi:hypothetical protein